MKSSATDTLNVYTRSMHGSYRAARGVCVATIEVALLRRTVIKMYRELSASMHHSCTIRNGNMTRPSYFVAWQLYATMAGNERIPTAAGGHGHNQRRRFGSCQQVMEKRYP